MLEELHDLNQRLKALENRFTDIGFDLSAIAQTEIKKRWKIAPQSESLFGMFTALCVDTVDPLKQNRVRFYSPYFHRNNIPVKSLPWAYPISSMGGFDDCGLNWVPPAGSTLCIIFEMGSRSSPFYIGTTWHRDRGPDGKHNWNYNIEEYYRIHEGHRKSYLVGPNDGSQVLPPWNTESSNGYDYDSIQDFENNPEARRKITYPNIYGLKTPQKHYIKLVDGDYKCNHKFKRLELGSSCGNWMIFKDDWLHNSGTWAHTSCGSQGPELDCLDENGKPKEITTCDGESSSSTILGGHPATPENTTYGLKSNYGSNPYFKHANECRPYKGPGTPQNNKCILPQSGIQLLSRSGQTIVLDDSVEEPRGIPNHESSTENFDYGCNDKFLGKIMIVSSTGHQFQMSDVEEESKLRGKNNFIRLKSASGNLIELNDHTTGKKNCPGCPPNLAGSKRGISLISTSNHHIMMCDEDNEQCSPCRKDNGEVTWDSAGSTNTAKAKKAFIRIRSGYGLEILMKDQDSQEKTATQHIQIYCPQKDNKIRGPHLFRMQERSDGPGLMFLRVGGNYVCSTHDNHYTIVGETDNNPTNKISVVSKHNIEISEEMYLNTAKLHLLIADKYILLLAGKELSPRCKDQDGNCGPCAWPVLCMTNKGITISDRVFASASPNASTAHIFHLLPFMSTKSSQSNAC